MLKIDKDLESRVLAAIRDRLALDADSKVCIQSIDVDEERAEIRIVLLIETANSPEQIADRYFGMTGKIREALGETWQEYFPIITPLVGNGANA